MSRYNSRRKGTNRNEKWEKTFEDRGVKEIQQYTTPRLKKVTEKQLQRVVTKDYIWKQGDRMWRLASREFGDPRLWWVIARMNNKPTDALFETGQIIKIPTDVTIALEVFGV